jgi:chemotaxis signal transduction protein
MMHHLLFSVDNVQCAIPIASTRIVVQMVQMQPGPGLPGSAGSINLHGQIIPVYSVRSFFGIQDRAPRLTDKLIVIEADAGCTALWADETRVVQQSPVLPAPPENRRKGQPVVPGLDLTGDGIYLVVDTTKFLESGIRGTLRTAFMSSGARGEDSI